MAVNAFVHSRLLGMLGLCLGLLLLAAASSVAEAQGDPAKAKREIDKLDSETRSRQLKAMIAAGTLVGPMHDCVEENIKRYTLVIPGQFDVIVTAAFGACLGIIGSYLQNMRTAAEIENIYMSDSDRARKGRATPPTLASLMQDNRPRWFHFAIEFELARQQRTAPASQ